MTAQEVAELLWAERQPFTLESVKEFLQKHSLEVEGEVDAFAQTVFEEALERTTRALKALWGVIGYGPYPEASAEIEGSLRNGGRVQAHYSVHSFYNRRVEVKTEGVGPIYLYPPTSLPFTDFSFNACVGRVDFNGWSEYKFHHDQLYVVNDQVFLRECVDNSSGLESALKNVARLRPLLSALGVEDIEEALRKLERLEIGESLIEGPYLLARNDLFWLLKRGSILGDPALDRAVLVGEPVTLTFPEGAISFSAWFPSSREITLKHAIIQWKGEMVYLDEVGPGDIFAKNPIVDAIKAGLNQTFERFRNGEENSLSEVSPKMLAFLKAFVDHENLLQALADRKLRPYVVAELFKGIF
jgi:hypothetical protein